MFENPRRGRQARNFTTNVPKILDLKLVVFWTDILQKLTLGAPDTLDVSLCTTFSNKNTFNLWFIFDNYHLLLDEVEQSIVICQWRADQYYCWSRRLRTLNHIAHEPYIICMQLFAGHVVGSRPLKRKKHLHQMIKAFICLSIIYLASALALVLTHQY